MEAIDFSVRVCPQAYMRADLTLVTDLGGSYTTRAYIRPGLIHGRFQYLNSQIQTPVLLLTANSGTAFDINIFPQKQ